MLDASQATADAVRKAAMTAFGRLAGQPEGVGGLRRCAASPANRLLPDWPARRSQLIPRTGDWLYTLLRFLVQPPPASAGGGSAYPLQDLSSRTVWWTYLVPGRAGATWV